MNIKVYSHEGCPGQQICCVDLRKAHILELLKEQKKIPVETPIADLSTSPNVNILSSSKDRGEYTPVSWWLKSLHLGHCEKYGTLTNEEILTYLFAHVYPSYDITLGLRHDIIVTAHLTADENDVLVVTWSRFIY